MSEITVRELNTYPVKSCAGISTDEVIVGDRGIQYDREWMVTRANGTMLTSRTHPQLLRLQTALTHDSLVLHEDNHGELALPLDPEELSGYPKIPVNVFKKPGTGTDQGPEAARFISDYLGMDAKLLRVRAPREINPAVRRDGFGSEIGFADGSPITLASLVSLRALESVAGRRIDTRRPRPNIWVDGDTEPYAEDTWRDVTIGDLEALVDWACARCSLPNADPDTGEMPKPVDRFVTQALRESRRGIDPITGQEEEFFMQNLVRRIGPEVVLRVNDKLHVVTQTEEPNFQPI